MGKLYCARATSPMIATGPRQDALAGASFRQKPRLSPEFCNAGLAARFSKPPAPVGSENAKKTPSNQWLAPDGRGVRPSLLTKKINQRSLNQFLSHIVKGGGGRHFQ